MVATASVALLSVSIWARLLSAAVGVSAIVEGAYLLVDVDNYAARTDAYLRASHMQRVRSILSKPTWRVQGAGLFLVGCILLIRSLLE